MYFLGGSRSNKASTCIPTQAEDSWAFQMVSSDMVEPDEKSETDGTFTPYKTKQTEGSSSFFIFSSINVQPSSFLAFHAQSAHLRRVYEPIFFRRIDSYIRDTCECVCALTYVNIESLSYNIPEEDPLLFLFII